MPSQFFRSLLFAFCCLLVAFGHGNAADHIAQIQADAIDKGYSEVAHWGWQPKNYLLWGSHSNRLTPVYTYGTKNAGSAMDLTNYVGANSVYRRSEDLKSVYGFLPERTVNPTADYMDQTDVYRIQRAALEAGKRHIFLVVFDGMDWQTTRAASIHNLQKVTYSEGRGTGTHFQDYQASGTSQFGFMVTAPHSDGTKADVNSQSLKNADGRVRGGYDAARGGASPWSVPADPQYLVGEPKKASNRHPYTDSASAAVSMTAGIKTYNNGVAVDVDGNHVETIAHAAQGLGYKVGIVTSVPISHATPAAAYAHNVHRNDYQDLTRDLVGLPSISHPSKPLPGLDVVLGGGWGHVLAKSSGQGTNFVPGNNYLTDEDLAAVDVANGGKYVVVQRTDGVDGTAATTEAATSAAQDGSRLLGFYGLASSKSHLPYQTADGDFKPVVGRTKKKESYSEADIHENPTLSEMTAAALTVLQSSKKGFWLLVEAGDVDWANHDDNLDNAIGAVNSGDAAVKVITDWVETNSNWDESLMIVTADHGHYLFLDRPELLIAPSTD